MPVGPSNAGQPGGQYAVVGDFAYNNPNCLITLELGVPGYVDPDGHTARFYDIYDVYTVQTAQNDPTPQIDSVTLCQPLVAGGSAVATGEANATANKGRHMFGDAVDLAESIRNTARIHD